MKEATEIAKLRLFLKLAAEAEYNPNKDNLGLEPLPDIDFNIRFGNSLVGFASMVAFEQATTDSVSGQKLVDTSDGLMNEVHEESALVQKANNAFRHAQDVGAADYRNAKEELNDRLAALNDKMNHYLANWYGTNENQTDYEKWQTSHQPFHWVAEFYGIIKEDGGFDVVIGNPSYVKRASLEYANLDPQGLECPDIYSYFLNQAYALSPDSRSHIGFIVMHNPAFHKKFQNVRNAINQNTSKVWFSFYGRIPAGLFSGDVRVRNCVFVAERVETPSCYYTTRLHRWQSKFRDLLFPSIAYKPFDFSEVIPMFNDEMQSNLFQNHTIPPIKANTANKATIVCFSNNRCTTE